MERQNKVKPLNLQVRYIGPKRIDLLNGKVYHCVGIYEKAKWYQVIDEDETDFLYPMEWFEVIE